MTTSSPLKSFTTALLVGVAVCMLLISSSVEAVSLCASDAQELQKDLSDATGMYSGQDVEINIVQGTYKTGTVTMGGPFKYFSNASTGQLMLVGGWKTGCVGFDTDPGLTVLDGANVTQVLSIRNTQAEVTINQLTIQNGNTTDAGGGFSINPSGGGAGVFIANNIIRNNHTTSIGGGFVIQVGGSESQTDLESNVISGNRSDSTIGAGELEGNGIGRVFIRSNTVYANTAPEGGTGGLVCCGSVLTDPEIYLNIFSSNSNYGLDLNGTPVDLEYNDIGVLNGIAPDHNIRTTNEEPKFVDAAGGNLHLSSASPLVGYAPALINGVPSAPSIDVTGNAFPQQGKVDLGAYAETIFIDGFSGN